MLKANITMSLGERGLLDKIGSAREVVPLTLYNPAGRLKVRIGGSKEQGVRDASTSPY